MIEDALSLWLHWWSDLSTGDLLRIRYEEGIRLRCTYPLPAFPSYTYSMVEAANRILDSRC